MAMALESQWDSEGDVIDWTADADYDAGAIVQVRHGVAGQVTVNVASGDVVGVRVKGRIKVQKTTSMVMLPSSKLFWDHSANKAHLLHGGDRDFFLGACAEDAAAADTEVWVYLNVQPPLTVGFESGFASVRIQTAGFVSAVGAGREGVNLEFSATAEAQKADALSHRAMVAEAKGIGHWLVCVNNKGDDASLDIDWGVATGTHATDFEAITQRVGFHIDGNTLDLDLASDDGTTDTGLIDTTINIVEGTPFLCQLDIRDRADIKAYVNGVRVLDGTTGAATTLKVAAAAVLKCIAHMEKTSDDTPANVSVLYGGVCPAQV